MISKIVEQYNRLFPKSEIAADATEAELHNAMSDVSLENYNELQELNGVQEGEIESLKESLKSYAKLSDVEAKIKEQNETIESQKETIEAQNTSIESLEASVAGIIAGKIVSEVPRPASEDESKNQLSEVENYKNEVDKRMAKLREDAKTKS